MHIGTRTFRETGVQEGKDSLPQVTGWIMAECRRRLWAAMDAAGEGHLAHVDTDSVLVDRTGLARLREAAGAAWGAHWQVKGAAQRVIVYGPRNYRWGKARKVAGVPRKAKEVLPNVFHGERWQGLSGALEERVSNSVLIQPGVWELNVSDPRRRDAYEGRTEPIRV